MRTCARGLRESNYWSILTFMYDGLYLPSTVMRLAFEDSNATAVTLRREQSMYVIIPSVCHEK